jgi:hypothetical protein
MIFWFKKKKIVLDCFTTNAFAHEYARVDRASKYYPEWWKNISSFVDTPEKKNSATIKACRGFTRLFQSSFILPAWTTIDIDVNDSRDRTYSWASTNPVEISVALHSPMQFSGFVNDDFQHIKLLSPWVIQSNQFVEFMWSDPVWNRNKLTDYTVLPAVIDFKYQTASHVNLMFEYRDRPRRIRFQPGDPMVALTPLTDQPIELRHHLVTEQEIKRYEFNKIIGIVDGAKNYSIRKKFIDEQEQRKDKKCPFHRNK